MVFDWPLDPEVDSTVLILLANKTLAMANDWLLDPSFEMGSTVQTSLANDS